MQLGNGIHLGYCTNIHRGETWEETFHALDQHTLRVKERVAPDQPYGIGLRLSAGAAADLAADAGERNRFRRWLDEKGCYLYTVNGFPYGKFHGSRVKEQVYVPDWTAQERLDYTQTLFDLLCELAPEGQAASVSTLPGSFKEFIRPGTEGDDQLSQIRKNLLCLNRYLEKKIEETGRDLHLGLEPEPLGLFETSRETVRFFEQLWEDATSEDELELLRLTMGVNYDTCHLAVEYEEAEEALGGLGEAGIRISKIHLSSALRLTPEPEMLEKLSAFQEDVYLHQVVMKSNGDPGLGGVHVLKRFRDLPDALSFAAKNTENVGEEWRVHFHVPLYAGPAAGFGDTRDHLSGTLDYLKEHPKICQHFEMETYTWEVLPESMRSGDVVDQLEKEYAWCLAELKRVGLA